MSTDVIFIVHTMSTLAMAGLIWFVQVVHYPLLAQSEAGAFPRIAVEHQRRTVRVMVPLMLLEAGTAILLVSRSLSWLDRTLSGIGLVLLLIIWISTVAIQGPYHRRLAKGYDEAAVRGLVATNWIRTVAWTLRAPLAMAILWW